MKWTKIVINHLSLEDNRSSDDKTVLYRCDNADIPMGRPFFIQVRLGGGIPVASQENVTGLLMVSNTFSSTGPSILGGTSETDKSHL